jgi:hypothetical protein
VEERYNVSEGTGRPGRFDPQFDDTQWTDDWLYVPIAQVPPGKHESGYSVERQALHHAEVFGQVYQLATPLWCRLLYDPSGRLWMSDTPQERIMMYNNGRRSRGHVLVGGLGLGLYPQYAERGAVGKATRFTIIERSPVIRDIVAPTVHAALDAPVEISIGDVTAYLAGPATVRFDTIFLDTWETLDATHLLAINRLRNMALGHLAPDGQVLLWGYHWMTRLFEDACIRLLSVSPEQRRQWLFSQAESNPQAVTLLEPVVEHFEGQRIGDWKRALRWCRRYIVNRALPA